MQCHHQVPRLPGQVPRRHRRPIPPQKRHQSQQGALSATPATQRKVDVTKCHACHAKCRGVTGDQSRRKCATRAGPVPSVPRLPRTTKVDVAKCQSCHVKQRCMSPSSTPATQSAAVSPASNPGSSEPPDTARVTIQLYELPKLSLWREISYFHHARTRSLSRSKQPLRRHPRSSFRLLIRVFANHLATLTSY